MGANEFCEIIDNVVKSKFDFELKHSSFSEAVLQKLKQNGSKISLVDCDSGREWTALQVIDAIETLAVKFLEIGIRKGDVVAFFCPNSDLHAISFCALLAIGGIYTGLIHKNPLREVNNVITTAGASYLICCKENIDISKQLTSSTNVIKKLLVIDGDEDSTSILKMMKQEMSNERKSCLYETMMQVNANDVAKINFSSGTTGKPKAVFSSHKNLLGFVGMCSPVHNLISEHDNVACIAHFAHGGGSSILCLGLLWGTKVTIFSRFESEYFVRNVQKYSVTFAFLVPSYVNLMNSDIKEIKSFSLKKVLLAGEILLKSVGKQYIEKFKPDYFGQGFGSTEMGWCTIKPTSYGVDHIINNGVPTTGCQIKIVDLETGENVGANKTGEIRAKGPCVTPGYLLEQANKDNFDEQGFFKTGDIGYYDDTGCLFYIERAKEIIKFNSLQVSVSELEGILLEHEAVKEAAVVGIADPIYGQLPKAFVVLEEHFEGCLQEDDLLNFVNQTVSDHKKLRGGLSFLDSLPKSILGKVDRKQLKSL